MTRRTAILLVMVSGVGGAMAQIPIEGISSHQPPEPPGFSIDPWYLTVTVSAPGTYVFRAKDQATGALGQINLIEVSPAVTGTVTVGVYDWDTGPSAPGAKDVWEVNLAGATDGRLSTFRIAGNYGDSEHGGTMNAERAETIHIGADVVVPPAVEKAINIPQPVSGSVTIGGKIFSPVSLGVVWGPLTVDGQIAADLGWTWNGADVDLKYAGTNPGEISIFSVAGDRTVRCRGYATKLTIETLDPDGVVQLDSGAGHITVVHDAEVGALAGTLSVTGDVNQLDVMNVVASGMVNVDGNVSNGCWEWSYEGTKLARDSGALPISTRDCVSATQNGAAIGTAPALVREFCGGVPTTSNPEETGEC